MIANLEDKGNEKKPVQLYEERQKRISEAVQVKMLDRVPVMVCLQVIHTSILSWKI